MVSRTGGRLLGLLASCLSIMIMMVESGGVESAPGRSQMYDGGLKGEKGERIPRAALLGWLLGPLYLYDIVPPIYLDGIISPSRIMSKNHSTQQIN